MIIDIDKLTRQKLVSLNHRIVERLKLIDQMNNHVDMLKFDIGEIVEFTPPNSVITFAQVFKYNKKTISIMTETGERWNVSPHLIKKTAKSKKIDSKKILLRR